MEKNKEISPAQTEEYHNTYILLKKYRDVVWSLELSVQRVKNKFQIEMGSSIEDFLESAYIAGVDFADSGIEEHTKSIERSHKMLKLIDNAVDLMRNKHKNGESYYWILYYSYLSPKQYRNAEEITELLEPHTGYISTKTYYRKKYEATIALSSVLWGFTSRDSLSILDKFFPAT